jgi:tape measure domain-containing protein
MAEDKLVVGLSADIKDLKDKLKETNTLLNNYAKDAENAGTKASGSFSQITGAVKGLVGAYISLQAAQTALVTSFNNSLKMDALQGAFDVIFGSSEEGTRQLDRLRAKANELGLEFTSLANAYKLFAGATTQSGMSISETNRIFDSVAKTSAVLKLSAEDTEGALRALAQMMGKGTVQAEELRGQLGERVPGAFKLAANAMGVTEQQLGKMLEQGQVMASDLLPKLADELDKAFGNKVKGDVSGLNAEWNKFKNNIFSSTSGFADFFATLLGGLNKTIDAFKDIFKYFGNDSQFQADIAFKSLSNALDAVNSKDGLNKLILDFTKIQATLQKGTPMWYAYTNAIIEAGKRIKDMQSTTSKATGGAGRVVGGEGNNQFAKGSLGYLQEELQKLEKNKLNLQVDSAELREANIQIDLLKMRINEINNIEFLSKAETKEVDEFKSKLTQVEQAANKMNLALRNAQSGGSASMIQLNTTAELLSESVNNLTLAIGEGMTTAFEQAFTGAESFGIAFEKVLVRLAARLLAALTAAIALATVIGFLSGGTGIIAGVAMPKFTKLLSGFSGGILDFGKGTTDRVVSAVGAGVGEGNVSFEIRGDKLYGVLQNYQSRLDRLQ